MPLVPNRPKIPARFLQIPIAPGEIRLHSLTYSLSVDSTSDDLLVRLIPLLDGEHRLDDILAELRSLGEERVLAAIEHLAEAGVLEDGALPSANLLSPEEIQQHRDQVTFFSHFLAQGGEGSGQAPWAGVPTSGVAYQERLKAAHVVVFGLGRLGSQIVRGMALAGVGRITGVDDAPVSAREIASDAWFRAEHVGMSRVGALGRLVAAEAPWVEMVGVERLPGSPPEIEALVAGATIALLCTDHVDPSLYEAFNRASLDAGATWTSCRIRGFDLEIGPMIIPRETPCYACFEARLKSNLTDCKEYLLVEDHQRAVRVTPQMPAITPGIGLVTLEVIKAITEFFEPATYAHLYTLNLLSLESRLHPVLKIPRCPACSPRRDRPSVHVWQQADAKVPAR